MKWEITLHKARVRVHRGATLVTAKGTRKTLVMWKAHAWQIGGSRACGCSAKTARAALLGITSIITDKRYQ